MRGGYQLKQNLNTLGLEESLQVGELVNGLARTPLDGLIEFSWVQFDLFDLFDLFAFFLHRNLGLFV